MKRPRNKPADDDCSDPCGGNDAASAFFFGRGAAADTPTA